MKKIILILFLLASQNCIAQYFFVDESYDSTYKYAKIQDPHVIRHIDNDSEIALMWDDYFFKSTIYVYYKPAILQGNMTIIIPNNSKALGDFMKIFSESADHVKISETQWKVFRHNKVYSIKLLYVEQEKKNAFYITRIE